MAFSNSNYGGRGLEKWGARVKEDKGEELFGYRIL